MGVSAEDLRWTSVIGSSCWYLLLIPAQTICGELTVRLPKAALAGRDVKISSSLISESDEVEKRIEAGAVLLAGVAALFVRVTGLA